MLMIAIRISRLVATVDRPFYISLDGHKNTCSAALFDPEERVVEAYTCPFGGESLAKHP